MALKVVVSGGPCAGKTSLVNLLGAKGFSTTPETARQLIADQQKTPDPIIPWTKPQEFQDLLWKINIEKEKSLPEDGVLIMDRCAVDIIGFCNFLKLKQKNQKTGKSFLITKNTTSLSFLRCSISTKKIPKENTKNRSLMTSTRPLRISIQNLAILS